MMKNGGKKLNIAYLLEWSVGKYSSEALGEGEGDDFLLLNYSIENRHDSNNIE